MLSRRMLWAGSKPRPHVWVVGTVTAPGQLPKPIVYHKRPGSDWRIAYTGADLPSGDSVVFRSGCRNPDDARGLITVACDYRIDNAPGDNPFSTDAYTYFGAQSEDYGDSWTYVQGPGGTDHISTFDSDDKTGPDYDVVQVRHDYGWNALCSPGPGIVTMMGLRRAEVGFENSAAYFYNIDAVLLTSVAGGPFAASTLLRLIEYRPTPTFTPAQLYRPSQSTDELGPPFRAPIANVSGLRAAPATIGGYISRFDETRIGATPVGDVTFLVIISPGGSGSVVESPMMIPFSAIWDGERYVLAGRQGHTSLLTAKIVADAERTALAAEAIGVWSSVFAEDESEDLTPSAGKKSDNWYIGTKGVTVNGGETWEESLITLSKVVSAGAYYYGITESSVQIARDGLNWEAETLPSAAGTVEYLDIFAG